MRYKSKIIYVFTVVILLFSSTTFSAGNILAGSKYSAEENLSNQNGQTLTRLAKWTVMYYMCGDSISMDEYIQPLLENLSRIGSTEELNIVVLKDNKEQGDFKLYYITAENGEKIELNEQFGWPDEADTSHPNTVELYCTQMMRAYPAEHYAFITYTGGGSGWQLYCLHDGSSNSRGITIPVLANSFKNIVEDVNHKIDVLFVTCAMGMIENAYEFAPYVDYMVATQDCLSNEHLIERFYQAVWDLKNNSDMNPEEFASRAPDRLTPLSFYYHESYYGDIPLLNKILNKLPFPGLHTIVFKDSTAVVNHSRVNNLACAVNNLSSFLILHLENKEIREDIKEARENTREYGKCYSKFRMLKYIHRELNFEFTAYDGFIDLYQFVELLKNNTQNTYIKYLCSKVMEKLNETIPVIKTVPDDPSHGLSIYFPSSKRLYNIFVFGGKVPSPYEELQFSEDTKWDEFLKEYLKI